MNVLLINIPQMHKPNPLVAVMLADFEVEGFGGLFDEVDGIPGGINATLQNYHFCRFG
jgi:hypothetical protein